MDTIHDVLNKFKPVCSPNTLHKIEKALGKVFVEEVEDAPEELGGYSAKEVQRYVGKYICIRPYFGDPKSLNAYEIEIAWSRDARCLMFKESKRFDPGHAQAGKIYIKDGLPYMYMVTVDAGEVRHIVVSRTKDKTKFRGLIQTLWDRGGEYYMPVSAPIVLYKIPENNEQVFDLGRIDRKKPMYQTYRDMLSEVTAEGYALQVAMQS